MTFEHLEKHLQQGKASPGEQQGKCEGVGTAFGVRPALLLASCDLSLGPPSGKVAIPPPEVPQYQVH